MAPNIIIAPKLDVTVKNQTDCEKYFGKPPDVDPKLLYCDALFDGFSCWPATVAGSVVQIKCPDLKFTFAEQDTTKLCFENGTWNKANYLPCFHPKDKPKDEPHESPQSVIMIYTIGFSITCIALIVAIFIFVYFRSLHCLRNTIHCNFFAAFLFNNLSWIITYYTIGIVVDNYDEHPWLCGLMVDMNSYFVAVPFFWMFIEGLYLYTTLVWAMSVDKLRIWGYLIIGWGTPMVITLIWHVLKLVTNRKRCWFADSRRALDYIIFGPVILLLAINIFFIAAIIKVLMNKISATNSLETQRKRIALRATMVLVPLLGMSFIVFIIPPPVAVKISRPLFEHINAVLQSSQGLIVAVIYCFTNGEVKAVLQRKYLSFKETTSITLLSKPSYYSSRGTRKTTQLPSSEQITHSGVNESTVLPMDQKSVIPWPVINEAINVGIHQLSESRLNEGTPVDII